MLFSRIFFYYGIRVETERDCELKPLVDAILRRRMVEPAIFLLEMSKPLVGCMRELYGISEPLVHTLFGSSLTPAIKKVLASSDDTEAFIQLLERTQTTEGHVR